ncbi:MAG: class I tRNA ligase family protein, partial [bacterium]|nr:class I tRNA ligase family protein [bacterium]
MGFHNSFFSLDNGFRRTVLDAYYKLINMNLIFRGRGFVNVEVARGATVSDAEIKRDERAIPIYEIEYKSVDGGPNLIVATTRPETMLGDTG